jgi:hypothetical protein
MHTNFWSENVKGKNLRELSIDGSIILKRIWTNSALDRAKRRACEYGKNLSVSIREGYPITN